MEEAGSDPISLVDVLDAVREIQEHELAVMEDELTSHAEQVAEARRAEALHKARLRAIRPLITSFVDVMKAAGNPGLEHYGGSKPAGGLFTRPHGRTVPKLYFWPLASVKDKTITNWPRAPLFVGMTPGGDWWEGGTGTANHRPWRRGSYYISRPVKLADLSDPTGFGSIHGLSSSVSIDQAVMESMAALAVRHELLWPMPSQMHRR